MRAILSVSDKTGLVELARGLAALGVELVSTGGTARAIAAAGIPVVNVSDVTGFPEMMDGRVKTLHPAMFGGILARRNRPDDLAAIGAQGITPIDLVVVNLYPFGKAADNPDTPFDALVEEIDIGGPGLLHAAARNFRDGLAVDHPEDYTQVLEDFHKDVNADRNADSSSSRPSSTVRPRPAFSAFLASATASREFRDTAVIVARAPASIASRLSKSSVTSPIRSGKRCGTS